MVIVILVTFLMVAGGILIYLGSKEDGNRYTNFLDRMVYQAAGGFLWIGAFVVTAITVIMEL